MKQLVDIDSWERSDAYTFFKDFLHPIVSVTSELDVTEGYKYAKEHQKSFFVVYLYALLRACNEIEEFLYRVEENPEHPHNPLVYKYDSTNAFTPISVNENGKYVQCLITYHFSFELFYANAMKVLAADFKNDQSFAANKALANDMPAVVNISATPNLKFTAISHPLISKGAVNSIPLINVGKMEKRDDRYYMPIAISIHHGLADGKHIADYIERAEAILRELHSSYPS